MIYLIQENSLFTAPYLVNFTYMYNLFKPN